MQIRRTGRQGGIHYEVVHFITATPIRCCDAKPTGRGAVPAAHSLLRTFVVYVIERIVRRVMSTGQTGRSQYRASLTFRHGAHRLLKIVHVLAIQYGCSWSATAGSAVHPRTRGAAQCCIFGLAQAGKMPTSREEYPDCNQDDECDDTNRKTCYRAGVVGESATQKHEGYCRAIRTDTHAFLLSLEPPFGIKVPVATAVVYTVVARILPDVVYTDVTTIVVKKVAVLDAVVGRAGSEAVRDTASLEEAGNKGREVAEAIGHVSVMMEEGSVVVGGTDEGDTKVNVTGEDCAEAEANVEDPIDEGPIVEDPIVEADDEDSEAEMSVEETVVETDDADSEVDSEEEDDESEVEADEDDAESEEVDVSEVNELEERENQITATSANLTSQLHSTGTIAHTVVRCSHEARKKKDMWTRVSQERLWIEMN